MMTTFTPHTIESAPEASRAALQGVQKSLGFIPNLFATMAESPEALAGYLALDGVLAKGSFTGAERQVLLTAVSAANECTYCTAAHTTFARMMKGDEGAIAAARGEGVAADPRVQALVEFTHAVVTQRGKVGDEALARFLAAGFTKAHALEVATTVGLKTISNYIDGFARVPLDAPLQPNAWTPAGAGV